MDGALLVDGKRIAAFAERDPANLPWADLGVDLGLECTGVSAAVVDLDLTRVVDGTLVKVMACPPAARGWGGGSGKHPRDPRRVADHPSA